MRARAHLVVAAGIGWANRILVSIHVGDSVAIVAIGTASVSDMPAITITRKV